MTGGRQPQPMDSLMEAMRESTKSVPIVPLAFESRHFGASTVGTPSLQIMTPAAWPRKPLGDRVKEPVKHSNPFEDEDDRNPFLHESKELKSKNPFEEEDDYDPSLNPFE